MGKAEEFECNAEFHKDLKKMLTLLEEHFPTPERAAYVAVAAAFALSGGKRGKVIRALSHIASSSEGGAESSE